MTDKIMNATLDFIVGSLYFNEYILVLTKDLKKQKLLLDALDITGKNAYNELLPGGNYPVNMFELARKPQKYGVTNKYYRIKNQRIYTLKTQDGYRIGIKVDGIVFIVCISVHESYYQDIEVIDGKTIKLIKPYTKRRLTLVRELDLIKSSQADDILI
jgi:hypothetical protein